MEFEISVNDFADKMGELYTRYNWGFKSLASYYLKECPYVSAELGLKFVEHYYLHDNCKLVFKVINQKKWILTKIKYGI